MTFQCSRCGEGFADLASFLAHMQESHGREPGLKEYRQDEEGGEE